MADTYTIYLVNNYGSEQTFWLFLTQPQGLETETVYANSSSFLTIRPAHPGLNSFAIPLQYQVGAGASSQPVGLGAKISSFINQDANIGEEWLAEYLDFKEHQGPELTKAAELADKEQIWLNTASYEPDEQKAYDWYVNQSFGIKTSNGYAGMTWIPSPNQTRRLMPKLTFYISTRTYGANELASWTQVSNESAIVSLASFDAAKNATVTYSSSGKWTVTKGKPNSMLTTEADMSMAIEALRELAYSHRLLMEEHLGSKK